MSTGSLRRLTDSGVTWESNTHMTTRRRDYPCYLSQAWSPCALSSRQQISMERGGLRGVEAPPKGMEPVLSCYWFNLFLLRFPLAGLYQIVWSSRLPPVWEELHHCGNMGQLQEPPNFLCHGRMFAFTTAALSYHYYVFTQLILSICHHTPHLLMLVSSFVILLHHPHSSPEPLELCVQAGLSNEQANVKRALLCSKEATGPQLIGWPFALNAAHSARAVYCGKHHNTRASQIVLSWVKS